MSRRHISLHYQPVTKFHIDPLQTCQLPLAQIQKHTEPLFRWAKLRRLETAEAELQLKASNWREIGKITLPWQRQLSPKREEHTPALLGWYLLQNLSKAQTQLLHYHYPYKGLRNACSLSQLADRTYKALILEHHLGKNPEEKLRHAFAHALCFTLPFLDTPSLESLCYGDIIKPAYFPTSKQAPHAFTIAYGGTTNTNKWSRPHKTGILAAIPLLDRWKNYIPSESKKLFIHCQIQDKEGTPLFSNKENKS
jgi:hypothetical protein